MAKTHRQLSSRAHTVYSREHVVGKDYEGLRRALEDEHERRGRHELPVTDYHELSRDGSLFRLHFREDALSSLTPPITDGWLVEPGQGSARARVLSVDEDEDRLIVRCSQPRPGNAFAKRVWVSQPDFRLRLRAWVADCGGRPAPPLLEKLRGIEARSLSLSELGVGQGLLGSLREGQRLALARASAGTTYLWGPPGTGKTYTVARMVQSLVARDYKVAVIAPTNVAVDTSVLAIYRGFLAGEVELPGGYLVRAGHPVLEELNDYPVLLAWQHTLLTHQQEMNRLLARERELRRKMVGAGAAEKQQMQTEQAELKAQIEDCRVERGRVLWDLAKEARVLATTVHGALHEEQLLAFLSAPRVALVIDEAGMVPRFSTLPLLELLGGGLGLQSEGLKQTPSEVAMILAGDPRQLGPIHRQSNESDVNMRYWLGESLMEELLQPSAPDSRRVFLDQQSRMDSTICTRISRTYYDNKLKTVPDPERARPPLTSGWPEDGVAILDPKRYRLPADAPPESFLDSDAMWNERNLWVAVSLIRDALASGRARSVMWLTPFRAQAAMARKFRESLFSEANVRVGTVHASQGGEADLVVFDPVNIGHRWLQGGMGRELEIERMLNVAVSRARGQVLVFATRAQLAKNDLFRRLLDDAADWVPT